ncbi:MAG: DNA repair protein RecO [Clostridiales bacterium]|nr:DNA repair protein RecO [Clostridiales bacterium]
MRIETEGIVLKQVKTSYGRKIIHLFTRDKGKISAGTGLNDRGRRSTLALQPFTLGRYRLFKNRDMYNLDSAEVIRSHYAIGEDVDKYMYGAYVLEFTEKILPEELPAQGIFSLLLDFFRELEKRDRGIGTLVLAYQTKVLVEAGVFPSLDRCAACGCPPGEENPVDRWGFSTETGGMVCPECAKEINSLIHHVKFDIINILKYFAANPLKKLENIALNEKTGLELQKIIREYSEYHLNASNIKSEKLI